MAEKLVKMELSDSEIKIISQALAVFADTKRRAGNNSRFSDAVRAEFVREMAQVEAVIARVRVLDLPL